MIDPNKQTPEERAAQIGLPMDVAQPALLAYRSIGIGVFGACMRFVGMPLEKIALFMNSSQVSGSNPLQQAYKLTFREGALAPYKVVGPASMTAWFLQYSVMGVAFQVVDQVLSQVMGTHPVYYGKELMDPAPAPEEKNPRDPFEIKFIAKTLCVPVISASLESFVSNRAEEQRFFGRQKYLEFERLLKNPIHRAAGHGYGASVMRNFIMCQTSFVLTPITYKLYFPQDYKNKSTMFWYGLGLNIFVGNVFAITQQSLWGRSLDYLEAHGEVCYRSVIREGLQKEGISAFFTIPKWFSRVLMNAPAQGTLPWFYNEVLPYGENWVLEVVKTFAYDPINSAANNSGSGYSNTIAVSPANTSASSEPASVPSASR